MELCDLWKNNMLVIAEIESISRFTFICKKDLEVGSKLYSLLEKENMKIFVISDELYKRLFDLTTEQLNEYNKDSRRSKEGRDLQEEIEIKQRLISG